MMTTIVKTVRNHRLVADRIKELEKEGFAIQWRFMGKGGLLQIKTVKSETRVQIGHGRGRYNYAPCVIL